MRLLCVRRAPRPFRVRNARRILVTRRLTDFRRFRNARCVSMRFRASASSFVPAGTTAFRSALKMAQASALITHWIIGGGVRSHTAATRTPTRPLPLAVVRQSNRSAMVSQTQAQERHRCAGVQPGTRVAHAAAHGVERHAAIPRGKKRGDAGGVVERFRARQSDKREARHARRSHPQSAGTAGSLLRREDWPVVRPTVSLACDARPPGIRPSCASG